MEETIVNATNLKKYFPMKEGIILLDKRATSKQLTMLILRYEREKHSVLSVNPGVGKQPWAVS